MPCRGIGERHDRPTEARPRREPGLDRRQDGGIAWARGDSLGEVPGRDRRRGAIRHDLGAPAAGRAMAGQSARRGAKRAARRGRIVGSVDGRGRGASGELGIGGRLRGDLQRPRLHGRPSAARASRARCRAPSLPVLGAMPRLRHRATRGQPPACCRLRRDAAISARLGDSSVSHRGSAVWATVGAARGYRAGAIWAPSAATKKIVRNRRIAVDDFFRRDSLYSRSRKRPDPNDGRRR